MKPVKPGQPEKREGGVVREERVYPHPRELVWRALTDPELLARWLMPNDFEPRVAHRFTFRTAPGPGFDGVVHCEVLELVEPERLAFSWKGGPLDTVVTFRLEEREGGTLLRMEHAGFRGVKSWLVGRLLALGNRTIYGRRLPTLLDALAAGAEPPRDDEVACMEREQGVLVRILGVFERKKR